MNLKEKFKNIRKDLNQEPSEWSNYKLSNKFDRHSLELWSNKNKLILLREIERDVDSAIKELKESSIDGKLFYYGVKSNSNEYKLKDLNDYILIPKSKLKEVLG